MFRVTAGVVGLLGVLAAVPPASAEGNAQYGVLIISRERLEVATSCEIGVYLNDQLSGRVFQEQSTSFNLPPGPVDVRLRQLPGQMPGCASGVEDQRSTRLLMKAGEISKYRITLGQNGLGLTRADLGY